jgi:serine/threonine protein kinase
VCSSDLIAAFDIARGKTFLHSRAIIHRDLKSVNILLDANGWARIGNFGLSKMADPKAIQMTQIIEMGYWMAPEILENSGFYDEKVYVYSYAILLWELVSRKVPFVVKNQVLHSDARPAMPDGLPVRLRELTQRCWERDANNRPSFAEILEEFRNDEVFLPGASVDEVRLHIQRYMPASEAPPADDAEKDDLEQVRMIISSLEEGSLPVRLQSVSWRLIDEAQESPLADRVKAAFLFLQTAQKDRAIAFLRKILIGTIPVKLALELVDQFQEVQHHTFSKRQL